MVKNQGEAKERIAIKQITILPGRDKTGVPENFVHITMEAGETASIVGPTGSGKTALITDIELLAQGDTDTKRRILIDGLAPPEEIRYDPALKPIAMITQNTKCFADLTTLDFLKLHARARKIGDQRVVEETIALANNFTGEQIHPETRVTVLSGGQTRSLLIADAIIIGASPIILLDEIENAGIFKQEVMEIIRDSRKIVIFVTHDPVIALLTQRRIIMENGAVKRVLLQNEFELKVAENLLELDKRIGIIREKLRAGDELTHKLTDLHTA